ncbi:S1 family peptidase [Stackebrandtia nassauensis]|uniref:Peptidase S1 and S6 chymotrypsin/Hap n=1 Tax=Stackebrandtia nassauensis (strain DSM 44728 / CIP 108903 / NRRL B-16338 / NBRC 102104 / LLR-40K-21) TaxID=446470 RepID=D3PWB1_STANL|nr:S1 family peptidase [Stackebrandtia nassauensis]ADD41268.1 peptidase S1 and S6 chymotrypsin/Hap [Stackebrandtia nassauensis DSM 44728]
MSRRTLVAATASTLLLATILVANPATASAQPITAEAAKAELKGTVDPDIIDAMKRDFGISADAAYDRLAASKVASDIESIASVDFFGAYGGTWIAKDGTQTVVAVTDSALADDVEALGATAKIVDKTLVELQDVQAQLDKVDSPDGVHSYYADVKTNAVTITASNQKVADKLVRKAKVDAADTRYQHSAEQPKPLYDIRGGDAYYMGGRCSVGFAVTHSGGSGMVTAGHCGTRGTAVQGYNRVDLGRFEGSVFPGSDYAWVSANSNWTSVAKVNGYGQADLSVSDRTEAATGASVCRSGSTTGLHCGTIGPKNQTVNYPQGTVRGMTRTNVCAEPGDSGGSWLSGSSAQGVTSGGSGNCSSGGTTYFFPLTPIFNAYPGLTLKTGGTQPPEGCDRSEEQFTNSLTGTGDENLEPNGTYYESGAGAQVGCLVGPSGTDFDLYLRKWNGSSWTTVARSESADSTEEINYNGTAGRYVWRVYAYSGSGTYQFGLTRP